MTNCAQEDYVTLQNFVKEHGSLTISYSASDSGIGAHWTAILGNKWPYCAGVSLVDAMNNLTNRYLQLKAEKLRKELADIDTSSCL